MRPTTFSSTTKSVSTDYNCYNNLIDRFIHTQIYTYFSLHSHSSLHHHFLLQISVTVDQTDYCAQTRPSFSHLKCYTYERRLQGKNSNEIKIAAIHKSHLITNYYNPKMPRIFGQILDFGRILDTNKECQQLWQVGFLGQQVS